MANPIPIGICTGLDRIPHLAPGYDYVELSVAATLAAMEDDAAYAARGTSLTAVSPPVRAFNCFAPGELRLTGADVDWDQVEAYTERALKRAADAGAQIIVVGSGGSRRIPAGYRRVLAWGQLVRFFNICADYAGPLGLTMVIEPLNRKETNIINSYDEGVRLARDVARDEIRVLADIYHFQMENEPLADIAEAPEWLAHVHLADSGRRYPGSGSYPLKELFALLKEIGYEGRASVECGWGDDFAAESREALEFLQELRA